MSQRQIFIPVGTVAVHRQIFKLAMTVELNGHVLPPGLNVGAGLVANSLAQQRRHGTMATTVHNTRHPHNP